MSNDTTAEQLAARIDQLEARLCDDDRVTVRVEVDRDAIVALAPHTVDEAVRLVAQMDDVPWHWLDEDKEVPEP